MVHITGVWAYEWASGICLGWSTCLRVGYMIETEHMLGVWAPLTVQERLTVATLAPEVHNRRAA